MKKWLLLLVAGFFLSGCGTMVEKVQQSEFWKHDTTYASCDHLIFSWAGYENPDEESLKKTKEQNWWGIPIEK